MPPWCESILALKVEAVQGIQVSLEWTETCGVMNLQKGSTLRHLDFRLLASQTVNQFL